MDGGEGRINDELTVAHVRSDGLAESIEAFSEEVEAEAETVEEVFDTLLVELPDACAVQEIRHVRGDR